MGWGREWPLVVMLAVPGGCGDFTEADDTDGGESSAASTTGPTTTGSPGTSSGGSDATTDGTTGGSSTSGTTTGPSTSSTTASESSTSNGEPICGNGSIEDGEGCDDDNLDDHDGCSNRCAVERGFECVSEPSECGPASILVNGDFEDGSGGDPIANGNTFPVFFPGTELWFADAGTFVTAEAGISPRGGDRMLRFDATGAGASNFSASNIQQAIDMAPFSTLVADDRVSVNASGFFNRVAGAEDSLFRVRVIAYSGSEKAGFVELDLAEGEVFTDLDPGTWEEANATLDLPAETTFVLLSLDAVENVSNDGSEPEFAGHYADDADVRIIVAPPR